MTWCFWLIETKFPSVSTNQKHYLDLGRNASSVWNFCARYSDVVLRGLKRRPRETSAVFSGKTYHWDTLLGWRMRLNWHADVRCYLADWNCKAHVTFLWNLCSHFHHHHHYSLLKIFSNELNNSDFHYLCWHRGYVRWCPFECFSS